MKFPGRAAFLLPLLFLLALAPSPALAQDGRSVVVEQRDAEILLRENGDAQFVETWVVNFRNGPFTFAFREIPKSRLRDITGWRVTENDEPLRVELTETDDHIKATWYFTATNQGVNFFSDTRTFKLAYTVQGAAHVYPAGDQFWWKFIEKGRGYPIQSARVTLHLPATFPPDELRATTYTNGSESGGARILDGSSIQYIGGPFPADTEWEIRAQFPHVITAAPEAWQVWDDRVDQIAAQNNFVSAVLGVVLLVGGPLVLLLLWYLLGRDKPVAFNAEFLNAPPDDTPPGVVGTLLDERADLQDILATVADLARRGYLRIRESDAWGTPEYERTSKETAKLAPFEKETLDALLRGNKMRRLDDVRGSFYYNIKFLQESLYREVVSRGFFPSSPLATRDFYFLIGKWGAILVPTVGLCAYFFAFVLAPLALFPLFMLELFFIGLLGVSRVMPQRTENGTLAAAKWGAFRRYLASIEKYANINAAQDQFNKYFPYAVAFGLEKSWIDKFKETSAPAPSWYVPYDATPNDWSWSERTTDSDTAARTNNTPFRPSSPTPATPVFTNSANDDKGVRVPSLNNVANTSFLALNSISGNMFDFLNTSAEAFTAKPETRSTAQTLSDGVSSVVDWVNTNSSSSDSSWSSSSSSSSSWSGGSSSGGGGSGGGSSGFG